LYDLQVVFFFISLELAKVLVDLFQGTLIYGEIIDQFVCF